jgi:hypothetical protein
VNLDPVFLVLILRSEYTMGLFDALVVASVPGSALTELTSPGLAVAAISGSGGDGAGYGYGVPSGRWGGQESSNCLFEELGEAVTQLKPVLRGSKL